MIRRPPISTLFPSPTLYRTQERVVRQHASRGLPPQQPRVDVARGDVLLLVQRLLHHVLREQQDGHRQCSEQRAGGDERSEEHTSELQSRQYLVCRLLLETKI